MKILVALKQVPDTESKIKIADSACTIDQGDLKWITSPNDEYALEEAIRMKEAQGAEVIAVSIGGDKAKDVLRNALALGADGAVLLKAEATDDPLSTARALANFAKGKDFNIIFTGHKCYGNDNGSVGQMTAELLGLPHVHVVTKLNITENKFIAEREGDAGVEIIEGNLPAVITAQRGLNEPRYANLKGIMAAKKKPIEEIDCVLEDATIKVASLALPPARSEGKRIDGDPATQVAELVSLLSSEAKIF
ncbi:MAG: electron transfer flavoprotein subunit beta/FixA family protein [Holophagaceae bacterium]|nr:electron transfer flavoprotein subunit beta/FixA family protein [Holophagaceae bacterium]